MKTNLTIELEEAEVTALISVMKHIGFMDVLPLVNSNEQAYAAMHGFFLIQQQLQAIKTNLTNQQRYIEHEE